MVERARVEKKVLEIVKEKVGLTDEVKLNDSFEKDLGADSLDHISVVMAIEDEFEIEISDGDADRLKTVKDVVDYVCLTVI